MQLSKHQNHIVLSWFVMKCRSWDRLCPHQTYLRASRCPVWPFWSWCSFPASFCSCLLNCLFVGYKLFRLPRGRETAAGRKSRSCTRSVLSTRQRITRFSDEPLFAPNRKSNYVSVSEPTLAPPITSSLTSSAERRATGQRAMFSTPGWGHLRQVRVTACAELEDERPGSAAVQWFGHGAGQHVATELTSTACDSQWGRVKNTKSLKHMI